MQRTLNLVTDLALLAQNPGSIYLWPPNYLEVGEGVNDLYSDVPCVGVTFDNMGVSSSNGNYHGTVLIAIDTFGEGTDSDTWTFDTDAFADDPHPDVQELGRDKEWMDRWASAKDEDLPQIMEDIEAHLRRRGWIEMGSVDGEDDEIYWHPIDE